MKLVATGDWHLYNWSEFSKSLMVIWDLGKQRYVEVSEEQPDYQYAKEMGSRLLNILNGLCDMRDYCIENNISEVVCCTGGLILLMKSRYAYSPLW